MRYSEEDFLPLSALQHFIFCKRQCALIHIEQIWVENLFTAEGRNMHINVHEISIENRKDVRIERGVPLFSQELGLSGKADVIEYHKLHNKIWMPFPIEYKRGKPKADNCDKIQLCAQAICLEEMLKIMVLCGAIYYGRTKHRNEVEFDEVLKKETKEAAQNLHIFFKERMTPAPAFTTKCKSCSFLEVCLPKSIERKQSVKKYLMEEINKQ